MDKLTCLGYSSFQVPTEAICTCPGMVLSELNIQTWHRSKA